MVPSASTVRLRERGKNDPSENSPGGKSDCLNSVVLIRAPIKFYCDNRVYLANSGRHESRGATHLEGRGAASVVSTSSFIQKWPARLALEGTKFENPSSTITFLFRRRNFSCPRFAAIERNARVARVANGTSGEDKKLKIAGKEKEGTAECRENGEARDHGTRYIVWLGIASNQGELKKRIFFTFLMIGGKNMKQEFL